MANVIYTKIDHMQFVKLTLSFAILLSVGCTQKEKIDQNEYEKWATEEYKLQGQVMDCQDQILDAVNLCFFDKYVSMPLPNGSKIFALFEICDNKLKYINSFINRGKGPKEVNAGRLYYIDQQNKLSVVSYNFMGKSLIVPADDINNIQNINDWSVVDYMDVSAEFAAVIPLSDTTYIVRAYEDRNNMFALFNSNTKSLTYLDIPYPDKSSLPYRDKARAYNTGEIKKRPGYEQFAYTQSHSKFLEIIDIHDVLNIDRKTLFDQTPKYTVSGNGDIIYTMPCPAGLNLSVSSDYVYIWDTKVVLPEIKQSAVKNGFPAGYFDEIMVADWNGKPVRKYKLDRAIVYGQVDPTDSYFYGFDLDDSTKESSLVRFKLPADSVK